MALGVSQLLVKDENLDGLGRDILEKMPEDVIKL